MKKIVVYVDSMAPAGGIERVIANLANNWIEKYSVEIIVKDKGEVFYELKENIKIISIDTPLLLNMKSKKSRAINLFKSIILSHIKLKKVLIQEKPDFIYTANPINSLEIFLLGSKYLNKLIISEHGSKYGYNKFYNFIKKIVYPKAYKLSVPTKLDTELYLQEGYPSVYIPHLATFKSGSLNDLNDKTVLNIGRLTNDKQQLKLLNIWSNLSKQNKIGQWKLLIVGKGEEKEKLQKFIYNHNIQNSVKIVPPTPKIHEIFKKASIFAFTSKYEGFGMVLLEAMSFGIPCIAFDCPSGPRDIIVDNFNGYLIENDNLDQFSMQLEKLMCNENNIRIKMGKYALETVDKWNNGKILDEWDKLFEGG